MPEISIVMPTYNQGKFIREAVDGILSQSFEDFQLIIVNDDSQDNTREIIRKYDDRRISHLTKEHGGIGDSLNFGFLLSTSKYETWFASDNRLYPEALVTMYEFLETNPGIDLVYANYEIGIMDKSGVNELYKKNVTQELRSQEWDPEYFKTRNCVGIIWLWRRELREQCGPFQLEPCEDYDMLLRMAEEGGEFAFLDKCLGWFRRHDGNMTKQIATPGGFAQFVREKARMRRDF